MLLPCRHILKFREIKGKDLFSNDLIGIRWKLSYVKSSHRLFEEESEVSPSPVCSIVKTPKRVRNMSQSSKFRELHMITRELASVASEATGDEFEHKRDILRNLVQLWSKNKTCMVIEVLETDQVDDSTSTSQALFIYILSTFIHKERSLSVSRRLPQFTVEKNILEFLK